MQRERPALVDVAIAIPLREGRVLIARRPEGVHLGGMWEFPGGKFRPGETALAAARRELSEETGLAAESLEPLLVLSHDYADRAVRLHCFLARDLTGDVTTDGDREWTWVLRQELESVEMPAANTSILRALRWRLGE